MHAFLPIFVLWAQLVTLFILVTINAYSGWTPFIVHFTVWALSIVFSILLYKPPHSEENKDQKE